MMTAEPTKSLAWSAREGADDYLVNPQFWRMLARARGHHGAGTQPDRRRRLQNRRYRFAPRHRYRRPRIERGENNRSP